MLASQIPSKFPTPFGQNAASGYIRPIPPTTGNPVAASLSLGFPPATAAPVGSGGTPPDIRDFNGILNEITAWLQWAQAGGFPPGYDATFSGEIGGYPNGAVLLAASGANLWVSTVDNNVTDPDTGGAGWVRFPPAQPTLGGFIGLIGSAPGGTQTASWTIQQAIALITLGGAGYLGGNLAVAFNGATVGANGMDTGSMPSAGSLSIYLIYNPATQTWATLGTVASSGYVYSGANMPAGYAASFLLWAGVTKAGNIQQFQQYNSRIGVLSTQVMLNNLASGPTLIPLGSIVPINARTVTGILQGVFNADGNIIVGGESTVTVGVYSTDGFNGDISTVPFTDIVLSVPQTLWVTTLHNSSNDLDISTYTI